MRLNVKKPTREDGKLRDIPYFATVKEARPRQGFFEKGQYEKLFAELPDYLRLPFAIGFFSGMREGEILGLDWSQVDFLRGVIQLRAGETKNDEVPQLRTLLVEQRAKRQPNCPYVCFRLDRKVMPSRFGDSGRHGILLASERGSERWSLRSIASPASSCMRRHAGPVRSRRQSWFIEA